MKSIMVTAPSSGCGKTTITMGVIRALKNIGYQVSCFKTGPDYIDTAFLRVASGKSAGNLDMHLQGREGIKEALSLADGDVCVIEGAMGYFDGIYNTYQNSSYDLSVELDVNCILIYTPKGEMFSAIPKIKGMLDFEHSQIKGIILNQISSHYYALLKEQIEKHTSIKVLGYVPKMKEVELKSRHLGLIQSVEIENIEDHIEQIAQVIQENIDMDELIDLMSEARSNPFPEVKKRNLKVGIAMDQAFSFYYRENIQLLEEACNVIYFSPLKDQELPICDLLYFGGGYPEVFGKELEKNKRMLHQIKTYAKQGGCIYAECGGLMYLTDAIEDSNMVGIFKGKSTLTDRLQRFGYIEVELNEECLLGKAGDRLTAHEFHKSVSKVESQGVFTIYKTMGKRKWTCGYQYKNVLAAYPHINFLGNIDAFNHMLDYVEKEKKQ